jgi:hypothetical protein
MPRTPTITAIAAALLIASTAFAQELPPRRAGLWLHSTTDGSGGEALVSRYCVDPASDKKLQEQSIRMSSGPSCSESSVRREGGSLVVEASCKSRKESTHFRTDIQGDFQKSMKSTTTIKHTPAKPDDPARIVTTATWQGACPQGWKPGDFAMADGPRMNIHVVMNASEVLVKGLGKLFGD